MLVGAQTEGVYTRSRGGDENLLSDLLQGFESLTI